MSEQNTYATRNEAVEREIVEVIEAGDAQQDEYDVEAIADAVLTTVGDGTAYCWTVNPGVDFWGAVRDNLRVGKEN